jgi:hypothetical protein
MHLIWVLIILFATSENGTSVTSVPGFHSQAACNAAEAAIKNMDGHGYSVSTVCVEQ